MAREDDFGAVLDEVFDGGNGGADSGVVSDVLVVVERDVEVRPHEHLLSFQVRRRQVAHALLRHGHHPSPAPPDLHRGHPRSHIRRQQRVRGREAQTAGEGADAEGGGELDARGRGGGGGGGVEERESGGGCG